MWPHIAWCRPSTKYQECCLVKTKYFRSQVPITAISLLDVDQVLETPNAKHQVLQVPSTLFDVDQVLHALPGPIIHHGPSQADQHHQQLHHLVETILWQMRRYINHISLCVIKIVFLSFESDHCGEFVSTLVLLSLYCKIWFTRLAVKITIWPTSCSQ